MKKIKPRVADLYILQMAHKMLNKTTQAILWH